MKLHSPEFEDELLAEAHQRLRASPEQMQEARHMEKRRYFTGGLTWFNFVIVLWLSMSLNRYSPAGGSSAGLNLFALWMLGLSFFHAVKIGSCLLSDRDLHPLSVLPVDDQRVFLWESQKAIRHSLWLLLYASLGFLIVQPEGEPPWLWVIAAVFIWLSSASIGWLTYRYLNPARATLAGTAVGILIVMMLSGPRHIEHQTIMSFAHQAGSLLLWLPMGWGIQLAQVGSPETLWLMIGVIAIGTLSICGLAFQTWKTVREAYVLTPWDGAMQEAESETAHAGETGVLPSPTMGASPFLLSSPEILPKGIWESWYFKWLTPAEKEAVNVAVPDALNWGGMWKSALKTLLLMALLVVASKYLFPQLTAFIAMCVGFMGAMYALPWGIEFSALFVDRRQGQLLTALHGPHPVSMRHVTRAMWKAAALRMIMALPLIWLAGCAIQIARIKSDDFLTAWLVPGTWLAVKILVVAVALQPMLPILWFLRNGRFTRRGFGNFLWILLLCLLFLAAVFAALAMFIFESGLLLRFVALFVCSSLFTAICHFLYQRGKVDLIRQAE